MKTCIICGTEKPLPDFYPHKQMKDGHLNKCKQCTKRQSNERRLFLEANDPNWVEMEMARHRKKQALFVQKHGRVSSLEGSRQWSIRNKHKRLAHAAVANAIKTGKLERKPCEKCGATAEAHHEDYSKPLDVMWLCPKHHGERHVEIRRLQRAERLTPAHAA